MKIFMGGTYDPVHCGHLRMALELSELFKPVANATGSTAPSAEIHLLPCFQPVHRGEPGATSQQRVAMLTMATEGEPALVVDQREIQRGGPSYTVESLEDIREQCGAEEPVALVLGTDAFNGLASWHRWQEIPQLAHLIVLHRPGWALSTTDELKELMSVRNVAEISALHAQPAGCILPLELTGLDISSSKVRTSIMSGHSARYLVPDSVWRYICDNRLYGYQY